MSLKKHIEQFEESLLEEKINNPIYKNIGLLQEHIAKFEESLGETPIIKSTSKDVGFTPTEQLQLEIRNKDKIIKNLEEESSILAHQVLTLDKEKSTILGELNQSKWLENKVTSSTKQMYEDKIQKIIDANTYNGLKAKLRFTEWRKI